jgi:hypothetical protein
MQSMLAGQSGNTSMNFIGDPAAAGQKKVLSSWFSVQVRFILFGKGQLSL